MIAETKPKLTQRQQIVLDYIRRNPHASYREIQAHFGWSSMTAVVSHLRLLERKGYLARPNGKSRSIQLADDPVAELKDAARSVLAVCESSNLTEREAHKRLARALEPFGGVGT